jgi:hypothetical protein
MQDQETTPPPTTASEHPTATQRHVEPVLMAEQSQSSLGAIGATASLPTAPLPQTHPATLQEQGSPDTPVQSPSPILEGVADELGHDDSRVVKRAKNSSNSSDSSKRVEFAPIPNPSHRPTSPPKNAPSSTPKATSC